MRRSTNFSSAALIDYSGLAKTVGDLIRGSGLQPLELVDFFALTEALVLNDRLIVIGGRWPEDNPTAGLLRKLEYAEILDYKNPTPIHLPDHPVSAEYRSERFGGWTPEDEWYEAGRVLGAERALGVPPVDLLRHRREYMRYGLVREQHSVCSLLAHYSDLSRALQKTRVATRRTGSAGVGSSQRGA